MSDAEECEPLQEHICSAAPAVIEDYKETNALNKELEVPFLFLIGTVSQHIPCCFSFTGPVGILAR